MKVNGKVVALGKKLTLQDYLNAQAFDLRLIAVELNGKLVPKSAYASVFLSDEDVLEIVRFVGGG
ncbi:MAG TPA: thiamine biosynthesis protein ThiS [Firmicutes bacterium]|nr:thiamine biosynthesis protein ThiS [Bacillota bacterium]